MLGYEGLEVRLGEVVELVIGVVPEVVGALAALARLWVVQRSDQASRSLFAAATSRSPWSSRVSTRS